MDGRRTIQFIGSDGKRRSIRLGKVSQRQAEAIKLRVEALNAAIISKCPLDGDTARWVAEIGDDLADKLAAVGLIPRRSSSLLGEFLSSYISGRTDVKPRTRINLEACKARLVEFFGADKPLKDISQGDADAWVVWLKGKYAGGTTGRTIKRAKQFFKAAVRSRLIPASPFADVKGSAATDKSRRFFVTRETTAKVLDACPDVEWRLIVALARYAGIRIPSELLLLTWSDVLWEQGRFRVRSPKTEHHEGKSERWVPIFPELRPYLEAAFDAAPEGAVHLVSQRNDGVNLRTRLLRIIRRAGCTAWPKLFVNLRSSRETELVAVYPLHVVCAWLGNSELIAQKHYLQVTDADFEHAAGLQAVQKAVQCGAEAVQNPVQSAFARDCPETTQAPVGQELVQILTTVVNRLQVGGIPPRGER
jgi:site-specific recombinase XerD